MANSNTLPSRLGIVNLGVAPGTADSHALFLKVFGGEVITQFKKATKTMGRHQVRTISSGRSAQFPVMGTATAKYHTVGENILDAGNNYLNRIRKAERTIAIDKELTSNVFIPKIDELKNHYDIRGPYAIELGDALAQAADQRVLGMILKAARIPAGQIFSGSPGGGEVTVTPAAGGGAFTSLTGTELVAGIYQAKRLMDEKNIPEAGRYCYVAPQEYIKIVTDAKDLLDTDLQNAGNGSYSAGKVFRAAGMEIVMTNNMPTTAFANTDNQADGASGDAVNDYQVDPTNGTAGNAVAALCVQSSAVATLKLMDLSLETQRKAELRGDIIIAAYAMGHGILRPECAVEINTTAVP